MSYLRTIIFAAGVALASALLLQDAAVADPPDWAPAHGYRNKHHKHADKHHKHKHHRYKRDYDEDEDEDEDEDDARYGYYRDRDGRRDAYRDNEPYRASRRDESSTVDQPIFVNGECTPKNVTVTNAEAGAAMGSALGTAVGSGNPLATVAGSIAGAMLGSKADAARTTSMDEDCFRQVLERAPDRQQVAWDNDGSSTHYELTPVRSYRRSGQTCRELVTTIERHGAVREVYRTACRQSDGRWQLMD